MSDVTSQFGHRLRSLRTKRGLTQQELGEKADLGFKYLGAVERGTENPSLRVIAKLADALEVELHDLFQFRHETTSPTELRRELNGLLKKADVTEFQQAVKLLRSLRS